jgi:hypothetical protein
MSIRLNITIDDDVYASLKRDCPAKRISPFINATLRARLRPSPRALAAGYKAAAKEPGRQALTREWDTLETEGWPEW